ncbi:transcriptional regulator [Streptomyces sp. NPDC087856]|uniref:transcriptional regulator n=1 Tax=Streptomyces sp. NPDC087856 TaxID=3365811 RepID=UPI0037FFF1ED
MPAMPSGIPACPDPDRPRRLAAQLTDMIPGATTIRFGLSDPAMTWPHPHVIVKDGSGRTIELSRTAARVTARWMMRVWPGMDWTRPHTFDLAGAALIPSDLLTARRGR